MKRAHFLYFLTDGTGEGHFDGFSQCVQSVLARLQAFAPASFILLVRFEQLQHFVRRTVHGRLRKSLASLSHQSDGVLQGVFLMLTTLILNNFALGQSM